MIQKLQNNSLQGRSSQAFNKSNTNLFKVLLLSIIFFNANLTNGLTISGNANWNSPGYLTTFPSYTNGITVTNGAWLTINGLTLVMQPGAIITIENGSHLVLMNTIITSTNTANIAVNWAGIIVNGTANVEQWSVFPDPDIYWDISAFDGTLNTEATTKQACIEMYGSTISNADMAIESTNGGIIRVLDGSILEKGKEYIKIGAYKSALRPEVNACCIINTDLKWNLSYGCTDPNTSSRYMVQMYDVSGVLIGGSTFNNSYTGKCCTRDVAIFSLGADYKVTEGGNQFCLDNMNCKSICNGDPYKSRSVFTNFDKAIVSSGSALPTGNHSVKISVRYSDFNHNIIGVQLDEGMGIRIDNNKFTSGRPIVNNVFEPYDGINCQGLGLSSTIKDIILEGGTRDFKIYNNVFASDQSSFYNTRNIQHITIFGNNQNYSALIKKNTFQNTDFHFNMGSEAIAIYYADNNNNMEILCNNFTNFGTDIEADAPSGGGVVKNIQQNGTSKSANNNFSAFPTTIGRYRFHHSSAKGIITYYSDGSLGQIPVSWGLSGTSQGINEIPASLPEIFECELTCTEYLTSTKSLQSINSIKIVPQPANNAINITLNNFSYICTNYKIYDIHGKLVIAAPIADVDNITISTADLNNGMYLVVLTDNLNQSISQKILVQH